MLKTLNAIVDAQEQIVDARVTIVVQAASSLHYDRMQAAYDHDIACIMP
jgi:hypothetical protein